MGKTLKLLTHLRDFFKKKILCEIIIFLNFVFKKWPPLAIQSLHQPKGMYLVITFIEYDFSQNFICIYKIEFRILQTLVTILYLSQEIYFIV